MKKILCLLSIIPVAACSSPSQEPSSSGEEHPEVLTKGPWIGTAPPEDGAVEPRDWGLYVGGSGGNYDQSWCPSIVGAQGRAASYVDAVQFTCATGYDNTWDSRW